MANIKSQIKRNRQNEQRRRRNKGVRSLLKTRVRRFLEAVDSGDPDSARQAYESAAREFDKAASKGVVHKNKAANQKSRLAKKLNV
ncbi:MAG: 30S ribosomal protein S20 [Actinomycetota bacterium]|nr:30S ribosomal protein S20 [Actinomycetota bacterium]